MPAQQNQEMESWRILLFARNGAEMLLFHSAAGFRLPELRIPRWERTAPNLNSEAKRLWNLDTVALFPLDVSFANGASRERMYHVMEVSHAEDLARVAPNCVVVSDLKEELFADRRDFYAVRQGMKLEDASPTKESQGPFFEFGSFETICEWVRSQLRTVGLHWNGQFRQLQASASFALIRFHAGQRAVWFKAVGDPHAHEFLITTTLAARFPNYVPKILATQETWNGWLMWEAEGTTLFESKEISDWRSAAGSLAELQIASISRSDEILAAGARDIRAPRLRVLCSSFFPLMEQLMLQQRKPSPAPLPESVLHQLRQDLDHILYQLQNLDVPDTLGHLDCNPGNIIVSLAGCTFLDWAEAAVGNPIFTFQYLIEHFRKIFGTDSAAEGILTDVYVSSWASTVDPLEMRKALQLAPALAAFAIAASSAATWDMTQIERPGTAAWLRSLTRRIHREVETLRCLEMVSG